MSSQTNMFAENNKKSQSTCWAEISFVVDQCRRSPTLYSSTEDHTAIVAND
ncbi:hypothetical protein [Chroogloeocystis siderophila]|uniref:hypothetical protein n=1 Tax=Chroogloeocystis siderophila TaxID=329163 RepID=UPI001C4A5F40|nr:hypothetical protein [Chroogloeocystis siderophila]